MISDLTFYINSIDLELPNYYFIKNNLIFRRDVYTFFVIARMIKAKLSVHKVKDYISLLKENDGKSPFPKKSIIISLTISSLSPTSIPFSPTKAIVS